MHKTLIRRVDQLELASMKFSGGPNHPSLAPNWPDVFNIHNALCPRRPHLCIRVLMCPREAFSKQGEYDLGSIGMWSQVD